MKKDLKQNRKLSLTTETIRTLTPAELDQANGGLIWTVAIVVAATLFFCSPQKAGGAPPPPPPPGR